MTTINQSTLTIAGSKNLFATPDRQYPVGTYKLASGLTGALSAGLPLKQGADAATLTPITAAADQVVAILAEDVASAAADFPVCVYEEGNFNKYTVDAAIVARGVSDVTTASLAIKARMKGIDFQDVIKGV